eukprot:COSAG02_NODE_43666_length_372_cov_15.003663_1_plen_39_part_01
MLLLKGWQLLLAVGSVAAIPQVRAPPRQPTHTFPSRSTP